MKVLHFGSNYYPNNGGNVHRMVNILEKSSKDDQIFVYTHSQNKQAEFSDELYFLETGIKILRYKSYKDVIYNLRKIVKENDIDIVVTHVIPANILACILLPYHVKIVTEVHSLIQSSKWKMLGKNLIHRGLLNYRTERYFVLSKEAGKYIHKNYGVKEEKIIFLPNGYEKNNINETINSKQSFIYGYVGTFYDWQGINIIKNNILKILDIDEKIKILLVGDGPEFINVEKFIKKNNLEKRVILTGMIDKENVHLCMKYIDILLIPRPSSLETETAIPLKIFEAIEYQKPIIISDVRGLTDVFDEEEAFIYKSNNSDEFVKVCRDAFEDERLRNLKLEKATIKLMRWPNWSDINLIQRKELKKVLKKD